MDVTFGSVADTAPEGFLRRRVHFGTLVELDKGTKEGILTRIIHADGFGTRELPLTIDGMAPERGHDASVPVGRLDMLRIAGTNVEAWGWLADTDAGRGAYRELELKMLTGNSIKMADVKLDVKMEWGDELDDMPSITAAFLESNVAATTLVMTPAFANARAELEEELVASLALDEDLEVEITASIDWEAVEAQLLGEDELMAADRACLPREAFTIPECETYQTMRVSRDGRFISGHLGRWGECHTGLLDRCTMIPRNRTNYSSFCASAHPLDDGGTVYTGPLLLLGGHEATTEAINKALEDPASAFADVVVYDGKIGPWVCGFVRPHINDPGLVVARGSRVSGHWKKGELYAICSTNAPGFDVPRATEFFLEDGELVASFAVEDCDCDEETEEVDYSEAALALAASVLEG